ncbi:hypothetical protein ACIRPS_34485 [Streptomyces griseoviridis]
MTRARVRLAAASALLTLAALAIPAAASVPHRTAQPALSADIGWGAAVQDITGPEADGIEPSAGETLASPAATVRDIGWG